MSKESHSEQSGVTDEEQSILSALQADTYFTVRAGNQGRAPRSFRVPNGFQDKIVKGSILIVPLQKSGDFDRSFGGPVDDHTFDIVEVVRVDESADPHAVEWIVDHIDVSGWESQIEADRQALSEIRALENERKRETISEGYANRLSDKGRKRFEKLKRSMGLPVDRQLGQDSEPEINPDAVDEADSAE